MKTIILLLATFLFASCGATIVYTNPNTGITIKEKIDGKINGEIIIPDGGLLLGDGQLIVEPAK